MTKPLHPISLALSLSLLFHSASPIFAAQPPLPDARFGAVEAYMAPERAAELRVGWDRMIIRWDQRQPDGPDQWLVPEAELERVNTALAAGREIVVLLMGTPAWATDGHPGGGVPRGLYLPPDDPGNLWAGFVRRSVGEYAGRIRRWIIWNEPDIAPEDFGAQFEGSVQDYYQLVKTASLSARQANPQALIHLAGLTHWHDVVHNRPLYLERFLAVARQDPTARAQRYYFDVVTLHIYFRAETVYELITAYRALLRRYGLRHPLWLNETNAPPMDDPQYPWPYPLFPVTMDQQARFVIQAAALALAAGAERVAVYKLFDEIAPAPGADSYGLFRPDGSARPAAEAYRMITTYFAGVRRAAAFIQPAYYVIRLDRGSSVTRVLWARRGQAVTVSLRASPGAQAAMLYNHLGQAFPLERVSANYYTLTLPAAECPQGAGCVVGGAPWLVVETFQRH